MMSYFPITSPTLIFFVVLLIILLAPIIMGKLRIPHIIGMVLAGVLIGEHGLHLLDRDNSFELFGKVGLLYIMFLAGLEMDMESVKKNSRRILADLRNGDVAIGLFVDSLVPAGLHHGVEHAHCLPHHLALRHGPPPQRDAQRGSIDAVALHGADDAGRPVGIV